MSKAPKRTPGTFDVVPRAMATDLRMTATAVRVVLYIASFGDRAFPSYATIAREVYISRRSAIDAVRCAEACGYLTPVARKDAQGDPTSNAYIVHFKQGGGAAHCTTPRPELHHGGVTGCTTVVQPAAPYREQPNESHLTRSAAAPAAPPGASGGRAAPPPDPKSEISTVAARARELTLTGSRPRTTAGREGMSAADGGGAHEARQGLSPSGVITGRANIILGALAANVSAAVEQVRKRQAATMPRLQRVPPTIDDASGQPTDEQRAAFIASLLEGSTAEDERRARLYEYRHTGRWHESWGPRPNGEDR